jgi:hypothetical protein
MVMLFIQVDEKSFVDTKIKKKYIVQVEWWHYSLVTKNYKSKHIICRMIQKLHRYKVWLSHFP